MSDEHVRAARSTDRCPGCGGTRTWEAAQSVEGRRLCWTLDRHCAACGVQSCDRGRGPAPEAVRAAVVARHGTHLLRLEDPGARGGTVPKVFRDVFDLSLAGTARAAAALRGDGYEGTHPEVRLLAALLAAAGLPAVIDG
ncbi:hypothetical protein [Nocardiopsis flavescens]|uniref:hypothetical protein n=1 Tax=Nocardiopsis flavescens TaxID=758803 RepID=UPI0009333FDE|nr:hypothetical protein [Nocardiopsis flavescens]